MRTAVLDLPALPIADADAMHRLGRYLARQLGPGDVLALVGDLGAGKTTLVRGLAEGLGMDPEAVTSPTFALAQQYSGGDLPLVHADLYRIGSLAEAEAAGLSDLLHDPDAVVAVEWPLNAKALIPRHAVWLQFSVVAAGREVVQIRPPA